MIKTTLISIIVVAITVSAAAQGALRPDDHPRSVTLTLEEYNRLLDLAARTPPAPAAAPVPAVVAIADLRVTIDRDTARGVFNLSGQVLHSGVTRVPIIAGATLIDATSAGRPLPLLSEGNVFNALIAGPAPFTLALEWGAPLNFRPGRAAFVLPVPQSGAARVSLDLPGEQADVRLSAGLITRRSTANGRTVIEATLDPGSATEVSWTMRDTAQASSAKDLRALAEILTLITLDESDVRMTALIDVEVTQGDLRTLTVRLPQGYELQSVSGNTLEDSAASGGELQLAIANPSARSHQFLVTLERTHPGGTFTLDTGLVSLKDVQRERGEVGVEGVGTLDLTAADRAGVHRIDIRELNSSVHALARMPVLSAFRYQRPAGSAPPQLAFTVRRFADAGVLAAVADNATATTMITSEGRALTEVRLEMRNRSQPFLKVELPAGATIVSVDLAGETAKPATGVDGTRIPLMRSGLSTANSYFVSFVYVHAGAPFQKKGDIEMTLPKMDVPIGLVRWEVFVPEQYSARAIDGNVIDVRRHPLGYASGGYLPSANIRRVAQPARLSSPGNLGAGQIVGRVVDATGATLPGATVEVRVASYIASIVSDQAGEFSFSGVPHGEIMISAALVGFATQRATFTFDGRPRRVDMTLDVGMLSETVTVTAEAPRVDTSTSYSRDDRDQTPRYASPSSNVVNLQARAAGVLPIRVDVPRAGVSHEFVKPLVVGSIPTLRMRYKRN
jgi:hypothetical protein